MAAVGCLKQILSLASLLLLVSAVLCERLANGESAYRDNSTEAHDGPPKCQPNEFFLLGYCQTCEAFHSWMLETGINLTEFCGWQPTKIGKLELLDEDFNEPGRAAESFSAVESSKRPGHENLRSTTEHLSDPKSCAFKVCEAFYSHILRSGLNLEAECGWLHPRQFAKSSDGKDNNGFGIQGEPKTSQDGCASAYLWIILPSVLIILTFVITYNQHERLSRMHKTASIWMGYEDCEFVSKRSVGGSQASEEQDNNESVTENPQRTGQAADNAEVNEEPDASEHLLNASLPKVQQIRGRGDCTKQE